MLGIPLDEFIGFCKIVIMDTATFFLEDIHGPSLFARLTRTRSQRLRQRGVMRRCRRKYSIAIATVSFWRKRRRETGTIAPKKDKPGPKLRLVPYEQKVRQLVADHPDATLIELTEILSP